MGVFLATCHNWENLELTDKCVKYSFSRGLNY